MAGGTGGGLAARAVCGTGCGPPVRKRTKSGRILARREGHRKGESGVLACQEKGAAPGSGQRSPGWRVISGRAADGALASDSTLSVAAKLSSLGDDRPRALLRHALLPVRLLPGTFGARGFMPPAGSRLLRPTRVNGPCPLKRCLPYASTAGRGCGQIRGTWHHPAWRASGKVRAVRRRPRLSRNRPLPSGVCLRTGRGVRAGCARRDGLGMSGMGSARGAGCFPAGRGAFGRVVIHACRGRGDGSSCCGILTLTVPWKAAMTSPEFHRQPCAGQWQRMGPLRRGTESGSRRKCPGGLVRGGASYLAEQKPQQRLHRYTAFLASF